MRSSSSKVIVSRAGTDDMVAQSVDFGGHEVDIFFCDSPSDALNQCTVVVEPLLALSISAHQMAKQGMVATFDGCQMTETCGLSVRMGHLLFGQSAGAGFHQLHVGTNALVHRS